MIDFSDVSKLTNLINAVLPILNIKFADLAVVLLICTEVSSCCNVFS